MLRDMSRRGLRLVDRTDIAAALTLSMRDRAVMPATSECR